MSVTRLVLTLSLVGMVAGLVVPALAAGQDESQLWSGKVGIMVPTASGLHAGIALGVERQLTNRAASRSAIELDYAHPSDVNDWYLLYNMRYHVSGAGYLGWGAGLNEMDTNGSNTTNFAYRVFYGQRWNRAFGEIGWLSGMRNGNSGLLLSIGTQF